MRRAFRHFITAAVGSVVLALLAACATATPSATSAPSSASYDIVIVNGRIVDGTGAAWFHGDLGIVGDRIAAVTRAGGRANARARDRVDVTGLVVAPGFIDIQGQSTYEFLIGDGRVLGKIMQGVTTEILGEGETPAPMSARAMEQLDSRDTLGMRLALRYRGPHAFGDWLRDMQAHGMSANAGSFVGAGTLRMFGMGQSQGPATPAALDSMRAAAARAMRDGGVPVEIFHLKAGGVRNWPKGALAIARIDSARARGLDIQADMYPYPAGGTGLSACLPPWASADGKLFENLANPAVRARIRAEIEHQTFAWESLCDLATSDGVLITELKHPSLAKYGGQRLGAIAKAMGTDWIETAMDLIVTEHTRVETLFFLMSEENVRLNLRQPWIKIGTDASGLDPDSATGLAHPRSYGTYPRILGRYVRDERVLTLEEAIRKFTSAVATRMNITDRGLLRPGMFADVTVFDPATIAERATFEKPHQLSVGVRHVLVNGVAVLRDSRHTGAKPGRALRSASWAP